MVGIGSCRNRWLLIYKVRCLPFCGAPIEEKR
nr:MAG TPA: hypothetical protein [Caudoviricetes sp.]